MPRVIAQLGPAKPNSLPKPKPNIQGLPSQNLPINQNPQDLKPALLELAPLLRNLLKIVSDRQEYDTNTKIFVAEGNVVINYKKSELKADRIRLNTQTQEVIAEGNVFFTRGDQRIRGTKLVYNYSKFGGELLNASGAINTGSFESSEVSRSPEKTAPSSIVFSIAGTGEDSDNQLRRFGFIADRLVLDRDVWTAENLRFTNDPFSPPEIELVATKATVTQTSPTQKRLDLESPRIIFDQGFSFTFPVSSIPIDSFQRLTPILFGFDRGDRDGVFYQQSFDLIAQPNLSFQLSPQLLIQRAFSGQQGGISSLDILGILATLNGTFDDGQTLSATASLSGLDFSRLDTLLRFNASHMIPVLGDHRLYSQYTFRDRLFNGSLGFRDINNTIGTTLISPNYTFGDPDLSFKYRLSAQLFEAVRSDLLPNALDSLFRFQSSATIRRNFSLLRGEPAPATKEAGLRFSPKPIVPKLDAFVAAQGVNSFYSNGVSQAVLYGTVGLSAEIGNFTKDFLDYTNFNLSYTHALVSGRTPFLFDQVADPRSITAGIIQQIYGPFRLGFQQSWNTESGNIFDSVYSLEYARRSYSLMIRYNPNQGIGDFLLRISDFNWTRTPDSLTTTQD
jgi:lipopolysaccharide export system protein LptA